jgi:transcriptional regulator with XRE-family HTH domain
MPSPSGEKIRAQRQQKKLSLEQLVELTTEFLLSESTASPDETVIDEAFFRKYKSLPKPDKKKILRILDAWNEE